MTGDLPVFQTSSCTWNALRPLSRRRLGGPNVYVRSRTCSHPPREHVNVFPTLAASPEQRTLIANCKTPHVPTRCAHEIKQDPFGQPIFCTASRPFRWIRRPRDIVSNALILFGVHEHQACKTWGTCSLKIDHSSGTSHWIDAVTYCERSVVKRTGTMHGSRANYSESFVGFSIYIVITYSGVLPQGRHRRQRHVFPVAVSQCMSIHQARNVLATFCETYTIRRSWRTG